MFIKKKNLNYIYFKLLKFLDEKNEYKKINNEKRKKLLDKIKLTKEQKEKIDEFYLKNYGKKISYKWHQLYQSYTGQFDERYFPEFLYIPYFEKLMNPKAFAKVFEDKTIIKLLVNNTTIKTPKIFISALKNIIRDENDNLITLSEGVKKLKDLGEIKLFIKPSTDSSSGQMCRVIDLRYGYDLETGEFIEEILLKYNGNFLVQECIENHESLKKLHPESINTFRIMTYIWEGKIYHCPIILRIGQGKSKVDNAHAGGIFIGVNDDGSLCKEAYTEFQERYLKHKDTNIIFEGYRIPNVDKIIEGAKKLHTKIPQIGIISWDFTLGKNNEIIFIESNIRSGSIWLVQMAHGCGIFGDNTASILKYLSKNRISEEI